MTHSHHRFVAAYEVRVVRGPLTGSLYVETCCVMCGSLSYGLPDAAELLAAAGLAEQGSGQMTRAVRQ